jgi:hypothetical protein
MLSLAFVAVWIPVFIIVSLIVTALRVDEGFVTYGDLIGGGVFGFFAAGAVAGWATKDVCPHRRCGSSQGAPTGG